MLAKVQSLIRKAKITLTGTSKAQVRLFEGYVQNVQIMQAYGFYTHATDKATAIIVTPEARQLNSTVLMTYLSPNKELKSGEVLLWSEHGQSILLDENKEIVINADKKITVIVGGNKLIIESNKLTFDGEIEAKRVIAQEVEDSAGSLSKLRTDYQTHTHETANGPTTPPKPTT